MLPGCMSAWKKLSQKHLGEEDLHAAFRQQLHIGAVGLQRRYVGHRDAVDALHHQHLFTAVIRVHLGQ